METTYKYNRTRKRFILFPLIFLAGLFLLSAVVMWLWNFILPAVSGLGLLTYWQAMGLLVLCKILFGGFRFSRHQKLHHNFAGAGFKEKFMQMNEEEKQQFKSQWSKHCCK
jgi:hypothetical protein